jgi:putative transposase
MLKGFKYRIYPNDEQITLIEKHFGCVRLVYNLALETKQLVYSSYKKNLSKYDLNNQIPDLKEELPFLKEVNSQSLQQSVLNLDVAYQKFFKKKSGFPKFKCKVGEQSFSCPQKVTVDFKDSLLNLPKFKSGISIVLHRPLKGAIKSATISKTPTGKYFVSILCETGVELPVKSIPSIDRSIGIDVGLTHFATIGNVDLTRSDKIENPTYLRKETTILKRLHRNLSKKVKGSKNSNKARLKLARKYEKIKNKKNDFLHKLSFRLVNDNQVDTICIEDLNVSGMMKNHKLARVIGEVSWSEFFRQLKYKSEWNGKTVLEADRFSATSKDCNECGYKNNALTLSTREWDCPVCKAHHDRDENAVANIIVSAYKKLNRDGLPELTPVESLPLSSHKPRRKARTVKQEKYLKPVLSLAS